MKKVFLVCLLLITGLFGFAESKATCPANASTSAAVFDYNGCEVRVIFCCYVTEWGGNGNSYELHSEITEIDFQTGDCSNILLGSEFWLAAHEAIMKNGCNGIMNPPPCDTAIGETRALQWVITRNGCAAVEYKPGAQYEVKYLIDKCTDSGYCRTVFSICMDGDKLHMTKVGSENIPGACAPWDLPGFGDEPWVTDCMELPCE